MNALGKKLGLTNSHFGNSNGWPDEGRTYVTARDLATLGAGVDRAASQALQAILRAAELHLGQDAWLGPGTSPRGTATRSSARCRGADGLKTGHTDEAGYGFTGSAEQNGRRLVEVVAGMGSWNERVEQSTRLISWGFNAWSAKPLYQSGAKVGTARVQLGSDSEVDLVAPRNLAVTVPAGLASGQTKLKIRYQGPIKAPIAKGQHVADLVILTADTAPQIVPLVAGEEVSEAGFFGRIWLGFKQLFGMA